MPKPLVFALALSTILCLGLPTGAGAGVDLMLLGGDEMAAGLGRNGQIPSRNEADLYDAGRPLPRAVAAPGDGSTPRGRAEVRLRGDVAAGGNTSSAPVPEPATGLLLGLALLILAGLGTRRSP
jgi:hypothetical protein